MDANIVHGVYVLRIQCVDGTDGPFSEFYQSFQTVQFWVAEGKTIVAGFRDLSITAETPGMSLSRA